MFDRNRGANDRKAALGTIFKVCSRAIKTDERRCGSAFERNVLRSNVLTEFKIPETKTNTENSQTNEPNLIFFLGFIYTKTQNK